MGEGADVNAKSPEGETALLLWCKNYRKYENIDSLVQLLIEKGTDVNVKSSEGETPLLCKNYSNSKINASMIQIFIEKGADVKVRSSDGSWTPLLCEYAPITKVSTCLMYNVVLVLLEAGADVNDKTSDGSTPLHFLTSFDLPFYTNNHMDILTQV